MTDPTENRFPGSLGNVPHAPDPFEKDKTDGSFLDGIFDQIEGLGEKVNPFLIDQLDDQRLIDGLMRHCQDTGQPFIDYFVHSNRFSLLNRWDGLHDRENQVTIPESPDNLHHNGRPRLEETSDRFNMEHVISKGIDPNFVLYFRVTQPATTPKPEYYWTSDFTEVRRGLNAEGSRTGNPVILVSTLADIARNGGLMMDVNDDQGIAVRQIGLAPYDQKDTLFSFSLFG